MSILFTKVLLMTSKNRYTLTVITNPASATCTLTYDGQSYIAKSAIVDAGTVISYSISHSTYGTETGSIIMNTDKTLTCNGTYSTSSSYTSYTSPTNMTSNGTWNGNNFAVKADFTSKRGDLYRLFDNNTSNPVSTNSSTAAYVLGYSLSSGNIYCCCSNQVKISTATCYIVNSSSYGLCPASYTLYGSNTDGSNWTSLGSYTKPSSGTISTGDAWSISSSNSNYFKYFRWYFVGRQSAGASTQFATIELRLKGEERITAYTYYWDKTVTNVKTDTYPWEQPILSANGTMGESSFAVVASSESSASYAAWKAFDDNSSNTQWRPSSCTTTQTYTFYNPVAINVTKLEYEFTTTTYTTTIDLIEGSNDNTNWTTISKADTTDSAIVTSALTNSAFYKYYRTTFAAKSSGNYRLKNMSITALEHI